MPVWDLASEDATLSQAALEHAQRQSFLHTLARDPAGATRLAGLISQWGDHAPTLPAGAIVGMAHAGLGPDGPVGQAVIRNGLRMTPRPSQAQVRIGNQALAGMQPLAGPQGPEVTSNGFSPTGAWNPIGTPKQQDTESIYGPIGRGLARAREDVVAPINRLIQSGTAHAPGGGPIARQEAGIASADTGKGLAREAGAVANTGLEALTIPLKAAASETMALRGHPEGGDVKGPFGTVWHVGSMDQATSLDQFPLYQQIAHGKSLGDGWLPGGPASEAAVAAQKEAGNIDGHALTYGRTLASLVGSPDSRQYHITSGLVDFGVAMELDPAAAIAREVSSSAEAARIFAPTSDEAVNSLTRYLTENAHTPEQVTGLRDFARADPTDDLTEALATQIKRDPGGAAQAAESLGIGSHHALLRSIAAPQAGVFVGLRPFVKRESTLTWLSTKRGQEVIDKLASDHSFSSIRSLLGDTVPVDVVARLADAQTPIEVRNALTSELGTSVAGPVNYKWVRPPEDLRLFTQMPKGSIDLTNNQQMVQQGERTLTLMRMPKDQWDAILQPMATARNTGEAFQAYVHGLGGAVEQKLLEDGVPPKLAKSIPRFFPRTWEEQRLFNIDAAGQAPRVSGLSVDGESVALSGPHLENEINRMVPPVDYRALRQSTTRWRQMLHVWNDGYVTDAEGFAGGVSRATHAALDAEQFLSGFVTGAFKIGALAAGRLPLRFLSDEHARMSAAGLDSFFHHPISYLAMVVGKRGDLDATGAAFKDQLADFASEVTQAVGKASQRNPSPWQADRQMLKAFVRYGKDDPQYMRSWMDELSQLHLDVPSREMARGLRDPGYIPAGVPEPDLLVAEGLSNEFIHGDTINDAGRALLNNDPEKIAHVHDLVDQQIEHRLRGAIAEHDQTSPDVGATLRNIEREMDPGALTPEQHDAVFQDATRALDEYFHRAVVEQQGHPYTRAPVSGIAAVKEWFSTGPGFKYLDNLRAADLQWGSRHLSERAAADAYLDSVRDRIMVKTSGDPTLMDAVADGKPFNFNRVHQRLRKSVDGDFRSYAQSHTDDLGPQFVKGKAETEGRRPGVTFGRGGAAIDNAVDRMFAALMDVPTRNLTRSPAFSQFYWKDMQRLMPTLAEDVQDQVLRVAKNSNMTLSRVAEHGSLDLESADAIAKARALAHTKDLLYYPGERTTLEDVLRNVMPFAPAWRSVVKTWSKLAVEHPVVLRRTQQGVQELQRSGFFHPDPSGNVDGDVFTMAGPTWMRELTGATGFSMQGSVKGLNIVGQGLPGIGLGPQILAMETLPHTDATTSFRNFLSPYGDPDFGGGLVESFFPGWFNKLRTSGFGPLNAIPVVGHPAAQALGNVFPPSDRQKITLQDLAKQAFTTMAASGKYDLSNPDTLSGLWTKSMSQAQNLYFWRGLAQFATPTAPTYSASARLKDGSWIALYKVAQDYHDMLKADGYDGQKATLQLVNKYGPNFIFATEPQNLRTVYGVPTDPEGLQWKSQHKGFASKYPNTYGYWVPQPPNGQRGTYQSYLDAIKAGDIQPLTVAQWSQLADAKLGNAIYDQLRQRLGPSPTKEQQAWLAEQRTGIQAQYPGFGLTSIAGVAGRADSKQIIAELEGIGGKPGALDDPTVRDTPLAQAARMYLSLRTQALTAAGRKTFSGDRMAAYRNWLYENGTELASRVPDFTTMWNNVFQSEVEPDG